MLSFFFRDFFYFVWACNINVFVSAKTSVAFSGRESFRLFRAGSKKLERSRGIPAERCSAHRCMITQNMQEQRELGLGH